ncbi:hypothetical protein KUCAC02_007257 [Chaenocephalus aceratus]|uniref:Uncharacterized protein n=1 Tax=Chaenocephalus aceratus TaxID=36190 RepID=A0ACB9X4Y3_CHAAC|nr:hypothetical protein KUCAC02_007257 [Chaenocephalus aceratus]
MGLSSAVQGDDGSVNKMTGAVGVGGTAMTPGLTSPIFCSSRPKKLLKTSSFTCSNSGVNPQPLTKKNYAQEYEFEDDEDKADGPADIRLTVHHHHPQQPQQDPITPKIKLPVPTLSPSESLLRTDSLSSAEPVLSDGSVGSAPSLGLSPGPSSAMDINRSEVNLTPEEMMKSQHKAVEITWKKDMEDPLNPESWDAVQKLSSSADEKSFDFKPGFMTSFLDFLKTGKKQGGSRPLSSLPPVLLPTPPQQAAGTFSGGGQCDGADLALSSCKPLDEDLKRNLETLPSFSSDEEDSVSKNQDLQKSISSAISALYDTPHSLAAAMACAMAKESPLSPTLPAMPPLIPSMENGKEEVLMYTQDHIQDKEEDNLVSPQTNTEREDPLSEQLELSFQPAPPDQEPEAEQPSPFSLTSSSPSSPSSSSSSPPPSPPTPEEPPAQEAGRCRHSWGSEEEDSESGGEGIFRERDEFVVRTEDIGTLKMALQTGREPPPIWRVQKALLQKFSPEIKDGQRQFCATSNYLGYFGDAKMRYQRLYVKFLENVNKKDYVRVCSRKPWHRAAHTLRPSVQLLCVSGAVRGGVNSRAMREVFRSYVEMLVSTALDPDMSQALEDTDDELYLPPMRKIDSLLSEQKKSTRSCSTYSPKMMADPLESGAVKVHLGGEGYNRKTLNRVKRSINKQQDLKLSIETCRIYSLYHSLHHYKYHTFLHCKKETDSVQQAAEDPGQEEVVQQCMANQGWLDRLFSSFVDLMSLSAKA